MSELKPCPFCGGEAEKMVSSDGFTSIGCLHCNPLFGIMVQREAEAEAVAAWNTRHVETCRNLDPLGYNYFKCSECDAKIYCEEEDFNYCPNCGREITK